MIGLSFCFFGILGFPFWKAQVFDLGGKIRPSSLVKVPDYYYQLADWLGAQKEEFRILAIPINNLFGVPYDWEYGHGGADPITFVLPKPIVFHDKKLVDLVYACLIKSPLKIDQKEGCLSSLLPLLNVKYLLVHNDIKETYFNIDSAEVNLMKSRLTSGYFKDIEFERSFGPVDLYKVSEADFELRFYFPKEVFFLNDETDSWKASLRKKGGVKTFFVDHLNRKQGTGFILNQLEPYRTDEETILTDGGEVILTSYQFGPKTKVFIKRKAPGYYLLTIKGLTKPWFLVFSENYGFEWKAFQEAKELRHFFVNGYANSWWVDSFDENGNAEIEIKYITQYYFYLGAFISGITFFIALLLSINEKLKKTN